MKCTCYGFNWQPASLYSYVEVLTSVLESMPWYLETRELKRCRQVDPNPTHVLPCIKPEDCDRRVHRGTIMWRQGENAAICKLSREAQNILPHSIHKTPTGTWIFHCPSDREAVNFPLLLFLVSVLCMAALTNWPNTIYWPVTMSQVLAHLLQICCRL